MVFYVIFALGTVVFVLVEGAILYLVIKFRRRPGDGDPEQIHGNNQVEVAVGKPDVVGPVVVRGAS